MDATNAKQPSESQEFPIKISIRRRSFPSDEEQPAAEQAHHEQTIGTVRASKSSQKQNLFSNKKFNCQKNHNESNAAVDLLKITDLLEREVVSRILTSGSYNSDGRLGPQKEPFNYKKFAKTTPRLLDYPGDNGAKMVACGYFHTLFIDNEQRLLSFGDNDDGQLGRDTDTVPEDYDGDEDEYKKRARMFPGLVECEDLKFRKIAAGFALSVGLDSRGDVYVFGNIQSLYNYVGLFVDTPRLMEKRDDGTLQETFEFEATKVPRKVDLGREKAIDIAAGNHHVVILSSTGKVYTFGEGFRGELGRIKVGQREKIDAKRALFLTARVVTFKKLKRSEKITKVVAGKHCSYAVTSLGNLYAWGWNEYSQLAFKNKTPVTLLMRPYSKFCFSPFPVKVALEFKVTEVAVGAEHLLLLDTDSNVHSCGRWRDGCLGLSEMSSNESAEYFETPQLIERALFDGQTIQSIACGDYFSLALTHSGTVYAWGCVSLPLGVYPYNDPVFRPTKVTGSVIDQHHITQISAGHWFCALIGHRKYCFS